MWRCANTPVKTSENVALKETPDCVVLVLYVLPLALVRYVSTFLSSLTSFPGQEGGVEGALGGRQQGVEDVTAYQRKCPRTRRRLLLLLLPWPRFGVYCGCTLCACGLARWCGPRVTETICFSGSTGAKGVAGSWGLLGESPQQ